MNEKNVKDLHEPETQPTSEVTPEPVPEKVAEPAAALEHPSYEALETKLMEMEAKANDTWNQLVRAQAELENVRRRAERDVANAHKYALEKIAADLLPVVDSLEQGLEKAGTDNEGEWAQAMREGLALTLNLMLKTLEKFGIRQLNPQGEPFNPAFHQAISTQAHAELAPNTVLHVLQKGYLLNDRLLRPALVVVVK